MALASVVQMGLRLEMLTVNRNCFKLCLPQKTFLVSRQLERAEYRVQSPDD